MTWFVARKPIKKARPDVLKMSCFMVVYLQLMLIWRPFWGGCLRHHAPHRSCALAGGVASKGDPDRRVVHAKAAINKSSRAACGRLWPRGKEFELRVQVRVSAAVPFAFKI